MGENLSPHVVRDEVRRVELKVFDVVALVEHIVESLVLELAGVADDDLLDSGGYSKHLLVIVHFEI